MRFRNKNLVYRCLALLLCWQIALPLPLLAQNGKEATPTDHRHPDGKNYEGWQRGQLLSNFAVLEFVRQRLTYKNQRYSLENAPPEFKQSLQRIRNVLYQIKQQLNHESTPRLIVEAIESPVKTQHRLQKLHQLCREYTDLALGLRHEVLRFGKIPGPVYEHVGLHPFLRFQNLLVALDRAHKVPEFKTQLGQLRILNAEIVDRLRGVANQLDLQAATLSSMIQERIGNSESERVVRLLRKLDTTRHLRADGRFDLSSYLRSLARSIVKLRHLRLGSTEIVAGRTLIDYLELLYSSLNRNRYVLNATALMKANEKDALEMRRLFAEAGIEPPRLFTLRAMSRGIIHLTGGFIVGRLVADLFLHGFRLVPEDHPPIWNVLDGVWTAALFAGSIAGFGATLIGGRHLLQRSKLLSHWMVEHRTMIGAMRDTSLKRGVVVEGTANLRSAVTKRGVAGMVMGHALPLGMAMAIMNIVTRIMSHPQLTEQLGYCLSHNLWGEALRLFGRVVGSTVGNGLVWAHVGFTVGFFTLTGSIFEILGATKWVKFAVYFPRAFGIVSLAASFILIDIVFVHWLNDILINRAFVMDIERAKRTLEQELRRYRFSYHDHRLLFDAFIDEQIEILGDETLVQNLKEKSELDDRVKDIMITKLIAGDYLSFVAIILFPLADSRNIEQALRKPVLQQTDSKPSEERQEDQHPSLRELIYAISPESIASGLTRSRHVQEMTDLLGELSDQHLKYEVYGLATDIRKAHEQKRHLEEACQGRRSLCRFVGRHAKLMAALQYLQQAHQRYRERLGMASFLEVSKSVIDGIKAIQDRSQSRGEAFRAFTANGQMLRTLFQVVYGKAPAHEFESRYAEYVGFMRSDIDQVLRGRACSKKRRETIENLLRTQKKFVDQGRLAQLVQSNEEHERKTLVAAQALYTIHAEQFRIREALMSSSPANAERLRALEELEEAWIDRYEKIPGNKDDFMKRFDLDENNKIKTIVEENVFSNMQMMLDENYKLVNRLIRVSEEEQLLATSRSTLIDAAQESSAAANDENQQQLDTALLYESSNRKSALHASRVLLPLDVKEDYYETMLGEVEMKEILEPATGVTSNGPFAAATNWGTLFASEIAYVQWLKCVVLLQPNSEDWESTKATTFAKLCGKEEVETQDPYVGAMATILATYINSQASTALMYYEMNKRLSEPEKVRSYLEDDSSEWYRDIWINIGERARKLDPEQMWIGSTIGMYR